MSDLTEVPDPDSLSWVEASVGAVRVMSHYAHGHGYSKLWRLQAGYGRFWLKLHRYPGKWAGEVHALRTWAAPLGLSPIAVAWRDNPPSLLLTEAPGTMASVFSSRTRADSMPVVWPLMS